MTTEYEKELEDRIIRAGSQAGFKGLFEAFILKMPRLLLLWRLE